MAKLFSLVKAYDRQAKVRMSFEVPYYQTVVSYCNHPQEHVNSKGELSVETNYSTGLTKCPKCKQVYVR